MFTYTVSLSLFSIFYINYTSMRLVPREIDKLLLHQGSFFHLELYYSINKDLTFKQTKLVFWHKNGWQEVSN